MENQKEGSITPNPRTLLCITSFLFIEKTTYLLDQHLREF